VTRAVALLERLAAARAAEEAADLGPGRVVADLGPGRVVALALLLGVAPLTLAAGAGGGAARLAAMAQRSGAQARKGEEHEDGESSSDG
jgi:hypothetical protein